MLTTDARIERRPLPKQISVLAVAPHDVSRQLERFFQHTHWNLIKVETLAESQKILRESGPQVVLFDSQVSDGDWRLFLQTLQGLPASPVLVLISPTADDRLWADVLNRGAYDVLLRPFNAQEFYGVITAAWRHWRDTTSRPRAEAQRCEVGRASV